LARAFCLHHSWTAIVQPAYYRGDADFLFFVGVESQTDHLAVGDVRRHWSPDALRLKDDELNEFEAQVRARSLEVCKKLIERYESLAL